MSDNIQRSEYTSGGMPTVLEVNTDTGASLLYKKGAFGRRTLIARSERSDKGKWKVQPAFITEYNRANNKNISVADAQREFANVMQKQNNNNRAAIINKHSAFNTKTSLKKDVEMPGVIDPKDGTKTGDTTKTPTTPLADEETGDGENPASGEEDGSTREIEPVDLDTDPQKGTRANFGNLKYPETRDPGQDMIKFDMLKYEPKKLDGFAFADNRETAASQRTLGSVMLPIPGGISDANACNWGDNNMNPLQIAGAAIALNAVGNSENTTDAGLGGVLGNLKNTIVDSNKVISDAIGVGAAAVAVGADISSLLSRTEGMILNPNLELLFQGPSLRPFSFQFKLSPRSRSEAKEIVKIIRFFKQGMAPIRENSRLFLRTPNTFKIKYVQLGRDSESPFMNKFKECALLSCNVQYTPEGNYAPYDDGAMSSYVMSLQFKELEPVYNDDYGDEDVAAVGF